jgi:hypothetical protein
VGLPPVSLRRLRRPAQGAGRVFHLKVVPTENKSRFYATRALRANAKKAAVRPRVEHVFAEQKDRMDLFVRTIGLARAELKIGMANLVHTIRRTLWLDRRAAPA